MFALPVIQSPPNQRLNLLNVSLFLRMVLVFEEILHSNVAYGHKVLDARCSYRIQASSTDCYGSSDPNETDQLVSYWCHILTDLTDHRSTLLREGIWISLPPVDCCTVLGQKPGFGYCLNEPIVIIDLPHTFGIRGCNLQCARTAEAERCLQGQLEWSYRHRQPRGVHDGRHRACLSLAGEIRRRKLQHHMIQPIGLPHLGKLSELSAELPIERRVVSNIGRALGECVFPAVSSGLDL